MHERFEILDKRLTITVSIDGKFLDKAATPTQRPGRLKVLDEKLTLTVLIDGKFLMKQYSHPHKCMKGSNLSLTRS